MTQPIKRVYYGTQDQHLPLDVLREVVGRQAPQRVDLAAANAVIRCSIYRDGVRVVDAGVAVIAADRVYSAYYVITAGDWAAMSPGRYEDRWSVTLDDVNGRRPFVVAGLFDVLDSGVAAAPAPGDGYGGFLFDDPMNLIWLAHA